MKRCGSWAQNYLRWRKHRRGAAVVEMAIILPVLVLLIFGALELGRAVMVKHILEEAARAGCRVATLENAQLSDVTSIVDLAMANAAITGYTITVDPNPPASAGNLDPVTVTVSVAHADVAWMSSPQFMAGATLTGICVMPAEAIAVVVSTDDDDSDDDDDVVTKKNKKNKKDL
jgi:Flp pilus assembly protein TadG